MIYDGVIKDDCGTINHIRFYFIKGLFGLFNTVKKKDFHYFFAL